MVWSWLVSSRPVLPLADEVWLPVSLDLADLAELPLLPLDPDEVLLPVLPLALLPPRLLPPKLLLPLLPPPLVPLAEPLLLLPPPPMPVGVPPVEAELVPLAGWVEPALLPEPLLLAPPRPPDDGDVPLVPVAPVPAAALGVVPAVSSSESWLVVLGLLEPKLAEPWLLLSFCCPHFISDPERLAPPLLLRRDQRKAPAAAAAVATAAAAMGRERADSRSFSPLKDLRCSMLD